jgi:hypothetical protein
MKKNQDDNYIKTISKLLTLGRMIDNIIEGKCIDKI